MQSVHFLDRATEWPDDTRLPIFRSVRTLLWFDRNVNLSKPLTIGKREPPRFSSQLASDLFLGERKNASMWDYQSKSRPSPF